MATDTIFHIYIFYRHDMGLVYVCACIFFVFFQVKGNIYIRALLVIYCIHIYRDRKAGDTGGKGQGYRWMRESKFWVYFKNYFPVDLVKTVDLSPDRNYLFASFPHGILRFDR